MIEGISQFVRGQEAEAECQVWGRPGAGGREVARLSGRRQKVAWPVGQNKTRASDNVSSSGPVLMIFTIPDNFKLC